MHIQESLGDLVLDSAFIYKKNRKGFTINYGFDKMGSKP